MDTRAAGSVAAVDRQREAYRWFVACEGEGLTGLVTLQGHEVPKLYVHPGHSSRGTASLQLRTAGEALRGAGHARATLVTTGYGKPFF